MNFGWYARRLATMSPTEIAGRARDELIKRRWRGRQRVVVAVTTAVGLAAAALVAVALSGGQSTESLASLLDRFRADLATIES